MLKGENVAYALGLYFLAVGERERQGRAADLDPPAGGTDEEYAHPPVPCEGVACGKFHIARGNYDAAKNALASAGGAEARFYEGLVDVIRLGIGVVFSNRPPDDGRDHRG
ncbi:MAG: hypothetical protein M5R36_05210 [Deltaproteobacteria bacterium]|nr:hypothetical protein [Deltaproteobacteria bacterium]